ncbi:BTAD domain-containing putative transcriptional regulator [Asanoa sp. WMMD1127]|uniref:BTAD domain-containing putative transcriptional regulator n=1 Tax=Asanoa sp. WMMD1127 TaxID=3016107 RepID=UPI0024169C74|nr:BTAD domain-containing putative transcriptional regulator [Asanoa sp. WMMD1127]MDG4820813.1 BTAD domain-containing putative transcriptional regulator [Asanoa sp. WMMD1127]
MRSALLGPVQALSADGTPVELSGVRLRMLLARLALEAGRPVSAETLISDLWGEQAPADTNAALHSLVARLRRALGAACMIELVPGGYRLPLATHEVDAHRFEELAEQGRRELAAGRCREASALLSEGLALWRGDALSDVLDAPFAARFALRLHELRARAEEDRFEAELRLGRHVEILAALGTASAAHPLNERLAQLRMRALATAGRQSDALAAYDATRRALAEELGVDPSPQLQQAQLALLRGEFERSIAQPASAAHQLPARLTSFVGREVELAQLARLTSASRLVTVVGPGGSGKTRLALELCDAALADGHGPRRFVPLADVTRPQDLAESMLSTLSSAHGRLYADGRNQHTGPVDRLAELLDLDDVLLILDNCEHLIEAVAELAGALLARLPNLRILATAREPLAIDGEALFRLQPLPVPAAGSNTTEAAAVPAVHLFVDRATRARGDFALDETTVAAVVEICRRLDGLPLALELAAARLRAMSVEQIAQRLDDRFRLLTSGSRTALPRQRTLLATVEWSWDLLDEAEQNLAGRLSAFPGGATLAALERICADETLPAGDVLYVVSSLVEKSIVQHTGQHYRMLESIRAFAAARLPQQSAGLTGRFCDYYLALAEEQEPLLRTRHQLDAIAILDAEQHNLVHALRAALSASAAATAARFVRALLWYWGVRGLSDQFATYLDAVLSLGDAVPEPERGALSAVRLGRSGGVDLHTMGRHPAAPLLRMAQLVGQDQHSPDPWKRASALWAHDFVLNEQGDLHTGTAARHEALRLFEQVGDRWGLVMCLLPIGRDHALRGDYPEAIALFERAAAVSAELGTDEHIYFSKDVLARCRARSGDLEGARDDILAASRQARQQGQRRLEARFLCSLASHYSHLGDIDSADRELDRLETLVHHLPYPRELALDVVADYRMFNRLVEGAADSARALLPRTLRAGFQCGSSFDLARHAQYLARLLMLEGDLEGAAEALGMSEAIRGTTFEVDPYVKDLVVLLAESLGQERYGQAYQGGSAMPRQAALDRLALLAAQ